MPTQTNISYTDGSLFILAHINVALSEYRSLFYLYMRNCGIGTSDMLFLEVHKPSIQLLGRVH